MLPEPPYGLAEFLAELFRIFPNLSSIHIDWEAHYDSMLNGLAPMKEDDALVNLKNLSIEVQLPEQCDQDAYLAYEAAKLIQFLRMPSLEKIAVRIPCMDDVTLFSDLEDLRGALCGLRSPYLRTIDVDIEEVYHEGELNDCMWVRPLQMLLSKNDLFEYYRLLMRPGFFSQAQLEQIITTIIEQTTVQALNIRLRYHPYCIPDNYLEIFNESLTDPRLISTSVPTEAQCRASDERFHAARNGRPPCAVQVHLTAKVWQHRFRLARVHFGPKATAVGVKGNHDAAGAEGKVPFRYKRDAKGTVALRKRMVITYEDEWGRNCDESERDEAGDSDWSDVA